MKYPLRPSPSEHQLNIHRWGVKFQSLYGRGPLLREIGAAFDIGRQGVGNILRRLEHYGLVERGGSKSERVKFLNAKECA